MEEEEKILIMKNRFSKKEFISMGGGIGSYRESIEIDKLAKILLEMEEKLNKNI